MKLKRFWMIVTLVLFACGTLSCAAEELSFEQHVRPVLKAYCFECHGEGEKVEGKLDVRLRRLIAAGGESGPAMTAGKPAESLFLSRIKSGEMPPRDKKVPPEQIAVIERWISAGAATKNAEPACANVG
jgi:hypothetical protein